MKNIPIFIMNRDRLSPLVKLVNSLTIRDYKNITIIDNGSTYKPLLDWYSLSNINVFYNTFKDTSNTSLNSLAYVYNVDFFNNALTSGNYILTDSDVIPIKEIPNDFIDNMVFICNKYNKHKVGLGLKIDDIPNHFYNKQKVLSIETPYWANKFNGENIELYSSPIDTTFAVYSKGSKAILSQAKDCFRTGFPYIATHDGWYYDFDNLPEDEMHYIKNLGDKSGACWSKWAKIDKNIK